MSHVWDAVHQSASYVSKQDSLRVTNLVIAAANRHKVLSRGRYRWDGATAREMVPELAQGPIGNLSTDRRQWDRIAELASEAAHLGTTPEGMHLWAAAYQAASTNQKSMGAYATHSAFAKALARITLGPVGRLRVHRIVDPSVGAGNLLLAAIEEYGRGGSDAELKRFILALRGVELDPRARELCCLLLWLAGADAGVKLSQIASNIRLANALTMDWWKDSDLFEVVLMNPPWESLRHKIVSDAYGARAATAARLSQALPGAPDLPPLYTAQGTGDRNLFKGFVELVPHLLINGGRLGALLPAAFASDAGMAVLRDRYLSQFEIARWTCYENRAGYFPIDGRYKFGLLSATRSSRGTRKLFVRGFSVEPDEVDAPHILLYRKDIKLIGGRYHIIPELSHPKELEIVCTMLQHGTPLFEPGAVGRVVYRREVDLTLGRKKGEFQHINKVPLSSCGKGTFVDANGKNYVPLLEGRSVGAYDCCQKSWRSGSGRTAAWEENLTRPLGACRPQYVTPPASDQPPRVAFCDVTAATNTRTVIATLVPRTWRCGNTAPVLEFESEELVLAGLGILNSMVFDWIARRRVSGLHLNKFCLEGLVWPRLKAASVAAIAQATWSICKNKPRPGLSEDRLKLSPTLRGLPRRTKAMNLVSAHARIEREVARGLCLSRKHLEFIYSHDRTERRGFWRYFDAEPMAIKIVAKVLREY